MKLEHIIGRFDGGTGNQPVAAAAPGGDHALNLNMEQAATLTKAAVLVALVERGDGPTVLLTQRTDHLANHPGQISFPGGHIEPDDDGPEGAALRETEEEVGLHRRHIRVIGRLPRYLTRTGFDVTPVVALATPPFDISPDDFEVAEVFEVPLEFLMDPANHQRHVRKIGGRDRHFYAIPYNDYFIWGATAGMLMNLYHFLTDR